MKTPRNQSEVTPEYHAAIMEALQRTGSQRKAAEELGVSRVAMKVQRKVDEVCHDD
jgi:molybdenum-dependent DNA-binding transcriptional regulator ModE